MNSLAIHAENLSKVYRIGMNEQRHETLIGSLAALARSPLDNFRKLTKLSKFNSLEDADIIWSLKDISFDVTDGEVIGIIGRNGAGKSTLLKILSRITEPTSGHVQIRGRVASLLEVGTGFHPDLTGRENIYINGTILGMKKREIDRKFDEIVEFSSVEKFIDTPVKRYSSGMRVRLAFSVAAHLEPEILVVDEVLAVGDAEFQRKCLGKMGEVAQQGRTVLFVSHNMEAIVTLCSRCIVLERGEIIYNGNSQEAVRFYHRGMFGDSPIAGGHVIKTPQFEEAKDFCITHIEMLDQGENPKLSLSTWDDVRFRVHYHAFEDVRSGSIILEIRDLKDQRLLVLDSGLHLPLRQGRHWVDCVVPRFPLSAGEYFMGGGLAFSNNQWLWRNTNVGPLLVNGSDVFHLGRPPVYGRMIFAASHSWDDPLLREN